MSGTRSYGFGGKLIFAALLALVLGYVWACLEAGRNPLAIIAFFTSKEPEAAPVVKKAPPRATPAPAPPKAPAAASPEPVAVVRPAPAPAAAPALRTFSAVEMGQIFSDIQDHLDRGEIFKAREKVQNTSRLMIAEEHLEKFSAAEARVLKYHQLLQETTKGGTVAMPPMTRILIKDGGRLVVKPLREDGDSIFYETLTGIRSRIQKSRCEEIKPLDALYTRVEVTLELKKQADYKNLVLDHELGKPLTVKDKPGRTAATGLQIFDLADFAARNGANDKLIPLFDEGLKRDPNLFVTVHEAKADRMVDVLIYFLSINSASDARKTQELLSERYADTKAYKDRVSEDADIKAAIAATSARASKPLALAPAAAPATPRPAFTPPAPGTPAPPPAPSPTPAPAPAPAGTPEPPKPEPVVVERSTEPERNAEPNTVAMPDSTNAKISALVAKGDRYFAEAMVHLRLSDPQISPDGWAAENKKALELFMKANNEGYLPAQDSYSAVATVPQQMLDRVRETSMRSALCRKRSVSTRR